MRALSIGLLILLPTLAGALEATDFVQTLPSSVVSSEVIHSAAASADCTQASIIYDTTHTSNLIAEITAAANGPAASLGDKIGLAGTNRAICSIQIEVATIVSTSPFDLTLSLYTDCSTDGSAASPCGNGVGTLIPGSTVTLSGITLPSTGSIFPVLFTYPIPVDVGDPDSLIAVSVRASRGDVYWIINEVPTIGSLPPGEPATSFLERCGSTAANNGCSRSAAGINNNFSILITALPSGAFVPAPTLSTAAILAFAALLAAAGFFRLRRRAG